MGLQKNQGIWDWKFVSKYSSVSVEV